MDVLGLVRLDRQFAVDSDFDTHKVTCFEMCNVLHIWSILAIPTYRVYDNSMS